MACIVMAYVVMAYIVMAVRCDSSGWLSGTSNSRRLLIVRAAAGGDLRESCNRGP